MEDNSFKPNIIKGDLVISPGLAGGDFVKAEATDTRLMGVVGLHIERANEKGPFHQLFYLDFEEYGLDDYKSFQLSTDPPPKPGVGVPKQITLMDVNRKKDELFGGLGGKWISLSEKEAILLIQDAFRLNNDSEEGYPEGMNEYMSTVSNPIILVPEEKLLLWHKICTSLNGNLDLINYFIMRHTAMDEDGENYLALPLSPFDIFTMSEPGTLYKNEIEKESTEKIDTSIINRYNTKSLISDDIGFRLVTSKVAVAGSKVVEFTTQNDMRISSWEASLILAQTEYISVFNMSKFGKSKTVSDAIVSAIPESDTSTYAGGNLIMIYKKDNSHVNRPIYRLNDDVRVAIYVRFEKEILIAGNDLNEIQHFESLISEVVKSCNTSLEEVGRYAFPETTLGHYVSNDFGMFKSFLEYIQFLQRGD